MSRSSVKYMDLIAVELAPGLATVGTEIKLIGNDSGESGSILSGYISRVDRNTPIYSQYTDFNTCYYQANASASSGSSGSPVFNVDGLAIGLQAGGISNASTDYFLPLDAPQRVLKQIQNGGEGLIVAEKVLPEGPSDGKLEAGDILIKINGKLVDQFLCLNTVLDENVGQTVAHRYGLACSGVFVSDPGYFLHPIRRLAIIDSVNHNRTPNLVAFVQVMKEIPVGTSVPIKYWYPDSRYNLETAVVTINRGWSQKLKMFKRNDTTGDWDVEVHANTSPSVQQARHRVPHRPSTRIIDQITYGIVDDRDPDPIKEYLGISSHIIAPNTEKLGQGVNLSLRRLPVELQPVKIIDARAIGVSEEWIEKIQNDPADAYMFKVERTWGQLPDQFQKEDVLLSLDGNLVTKLSALEATDGKEFLNVVISRKGQQITFKAQTVLEDDFETTELVSFDGLVVQRPHRTVRQSIEKLPSDVYVTCTYRGSPAHAYHSLTAMLSKIPHNTHFKMNMVEYSGNPSFVTLKKNERFFPLTVWSRDPSESKGWKRITYENGIAAAGEGHHGLSM
uniref:PDZ-like domain-containing protein n=1 Tax=Fusarium oxysporum (strain Fo5176) TaxID=660025 RepID=A0A0D2YK99_FUSOF